jgi:23S rRNA (guanosine2251-2'-O)-methyltransferase
MPRTLWDPRRPAARPRRSDRHAGAKGRQAGPSPKSRRYSATNIERTLLYGWHSVKAALENPNRRIRRIVVTENALRRLRESGADLPVEPEVVRPEGFLAYVPADAVHQGVLAEADPLPAPSIEDLSPEGIVLVLDQITDPHNVGAILRSAAAFAVTALVTTSRHSPEATGVLAKSASGALEYVPIAAIPNLARGLEALKARGFLIVGLDIDADLDLSTIPLRLPLALVLGAEGRGLRQLTRTTCDALAKLTLPGRIKSLNVSNAAALALHIASARLSGAAPG